MKPLLLTETENTASDLIEFKKTHNIRIEIDNYKEQLEELFKVLNPSLRLSSDYESRLAEFIEKRSESEENRFVGTWVYYPWSEILIHILNHKEFFLVRTNRNRNIITADEQGKLAEFTTAFVGLSIGNSMALSLVYSGISEKIKIADYDTLELSNLNRIRAGLPNLGSKKTEITSQQIFEINPYAIVETLNKISNENLDEFVTGSLKPKLIFEAIDDFEIKIRLRLSARKFGIPIVMLTNLGDRLLIDVERYDQDPNLEVFNGKIGGTAQEILDKPITEADKQKYALAIVGKENVSSRVFDSVMEVNKTLVGRPQVMSTVTIGGGIAAYVARRIALEDLRSGRYLIDFERLIN